MIAVRFIINEYEPKGQLFFDIIPLNRVTGTEAVIAEMVLVGALEKAQALKMIQVKRTGDWGDLHGDLSVREHGKP